MDTPTRNRIAKLHPSVRNEVTTIIQECDIALTGRAKVRVTQGLPTLDGQALPIFPELEREKCENPDELEGVSAFVVNEDARLRGSGTSETTLYPN
jgi:hypothetical protein